MGLKCLLLLSYTLSLILSIECALKISNHNHTIRCIPRERQALLKLKSSLQSSYTGLLESWGRDGHDDDCCEWDGIECSKETGHVTRLDLSWSNYAACMNDASLVELRYLTYLNLSGNYHKYCQIPEFIGRLSNLEELDLSYSGFGGSIPHQLGNLSRLKFLDLTRNDFNGTSIPDSFRFLRNLIHLSVSGSIIGGKLQDQFRNLSKLQSLDLSDNEIYADRLEWASHLHSLQYLQLNGVNLSKAFDWGQALLNLPHITELYLTSTYLPALDIASPTMTPKNASSSLSIVDLSINRLTSSIFGWLLNFNSSLSEIDLHNNFLTGPIPNDFGNLPFLLYLDLSNNHLNGSLPNSFVHLHKLSYLDLSSNSFHGTISENHLSNFTNMEHLFFSSNSFTLGPAPHWIPLFQLYSIGLSSCEIGPQFPRWLQTQTRLLKIDLSSNLISETVPDWFWNLSSKATFLNISNNKIHDKIPRETFSQSSTIAVDLSSNYFEGQLPLFNPDTCYVDLSKNNFVGTLSSLCNYGILVVLHLSDNKLSGELPQCWKEGISSSLYQLDLSNNNLTGHIHSSLCPSADSWLSSSFRYLQLSNNSFTGELPASLSNCTYLRVLDVGSNMISGSIPEWIGNLWSLRILILRSNKFSGFIPPNLCLLQQVQIMDLSHNNLRGCLVSCLHNSTAFTGKTSPGFRTLFRSYFCGVRIYDTNVSNAKFFKEMLYLFFMFDETMLWKGREYKYKENWDNMTVVDISNNKLQGEIPEEFGSLVALIQLNLSNNRLTGRIPRRIGEMRMLEVLDLSSNQLSGEIPQSISVLSFLSYLNLSNNNLAGRIPIGSQIETQDPSSFTGNPQLCGDPLPKRCHREEGEAPPPINIGSDEDKDGFFISMAVGFVIGFCVVLGSLLFRDFRFLNKLADWVYMRSAAIIARILKR